MTDNDEFSVPEQTTKSGTGAGVTRRAVARGVAWSVPVIAAAVAVPLAAASATGECAPITPGGGWASSIPAAGTLSPEISGNVTGWIPVDGVDTWASQRDNAGVGNAVVASFTTVPVTAGVTYTFTFGVAGLWSAGDSTPPNVALGRQYVRVLVDGADALRLSTRASIDGGTQIPMSGADLVWTTHSVVYVATETKDLPFGFYNAMSPRDSYRTNDDILVRLPAVTCA